MPGSKLKTNFNRLFFLLVLSLGLSTLFANEKLNFTIIHSSDEHSSLIPTPYAEYLSGGKNKATGGFARLATLANQVRQSAGTSPVLLLSSGDFLGGTPFSWLTLASQTPELSIMQQMGYDAVSIGNHEFDYGPEVLAHYFIAARQKSDKLEILCANLQIPADHPFEKANVKAHCLKTLDNGLKVGIFALLGKDANRLAPAAKPLTFSDQHQAAKIAVAELKIAGADVIVAMTHSGYYEDVALAQAVSGIDLILGGHNHIITDPPAKIEKTLIMHSGAYLQSAGRLELTYEKSSDRISLRNQAENVPYIYQLDHNLAEDANIAEMVKEAIASLNHIVAQSSANNFNDIAMTVAVSDFSLDRYQAGSETSIGNFITDAMRLEAEKITGRRVDIAMHANGIIRGGLHPATSTNVKGNLSLYDLITVSSLGSGRDGRPGYGLVSFFLTEKEVMNLLEISTLLPILWNDIYFLQFSGLRYQFDPDRAYWLWLPIIDKPLPAYRSILAADLYTGPGIQNQTIFRKIDPNGTGLCHVVTTHYMASYLPMVGKKLPRLNIILKNADGKPVTLDQTIIELDGRELKLWEATARYVAGLSSASENGGPGSIPEYYRSTGSRIIKVKGQSLWFWPGICLIALLAIFWLLRLRKGKAQP